MALELLSRTITSKRVANLEKVATGISHTKVLLAIDTSLILAAVSPLFGCVPGYEPGLVTPSPDLSGLTEPEKARMESIKTSFINASENGKIISGLDKKTRGSVQELLANSISQATQENITADQIIGFSAEDIVPNWTESVGLVATDVSYVDHDGSTKILRFMFGQGDPGSEWGQVNFFIEGNKPDANGNIKPDMALDVSNGQEPNIWGLEIASNNEAGFSRQLFFTRDPNGNPVILNHSPDSSITDTASPVGPNANFLIADGPPNNDGTVNVSFKFAAPAKINVTATPSIDSETPIAPAIPVEIPATPIEIPATTILEPVVTTGSEANKAGIPEGSVLVNGVYELTTKTGIVKVGKVENGVITPEAFLGQKIYSTSEEALQNKWIGSLVEDAMNGKAGDLCQLTAEPLPDNVIMGENIDVYINGKQDPYGTNNQLAWGEKAKAYFNAHPEELPVRFCGYVAVESPHDEPQKDYMIKVYQWENPDSSYVYISLIYNKASFIAEDMENKNVPWPVYYTLIGDKANPVQESRKLTIDILKDEGIKNLLISWKDNKTISPELQNHALLGGKFK